MHIPSVSSPLGFPAGSFLGRLARLLPETAAVGSGPSEAPGGTTTLTPQMLRAALMEIGVTADANTLALAEAFAHLGLPLASALMTEAHTALARAPGATPEAFALAKALSLPSTPAALTALTVVTGGIPPQRALDAELMDWLGLALDPGMDSESLAAHLAMMIRGAGRSTEQRLLHAQTSGAEPDMTLDTRATLLRLAQAAGDRAIRRGADTLAAHLEGQQLINGASVRAHGDAPQTPLYFAFPLQLPGEQTLAEMQVWPWQEPDEDEEDAPEAPWVRACVRVATTRLGRVQAELAGTLAGALTCRFGVEKPATLRLIQRHRETLAEAFTALGWRVGAVHCHPQTEFVPLWHGGAALTAPRARIDQRA